LVRKARPMKTPTRANQRGEDSSIERTVAHAANAMARTSSASGLLKRNINTATGVSARIAPATRPAAEPNWRFTVA